MDYQPPETKSPLRHPVFLVLSGLALAVLVVLLVLATGQAFHATRSQLAAQEERDIAQKREQVAVDALRQFRQAVTANSAFKESRDQNALLRAPWAFFESLRNRLRSEKGTTREALEQLAEVVVEVGDIASAIGANQEALRANREAVDIWKRLVQQYPDVTKFQVSLAVSHYNVGHHSGLTERPAKALAAYEQALAVWEQLARQDPRQTQYQIDLADTHHGIAGLLRKLKRDAEALSAFERASSLREQVARQHPEVIAYQIKWARSQYDIADFLCDARRTGEALAAHARARDILQQLTLANPSVTEYQNRVAVDDYNFGLKLETTDQLTEAVAAFDRARVIWERLMTEDPDEIQYSIDAADSHHQIGLALSRADQPAEALAAYQRECTARERLASFNSGERRYKSELARCHEHIARFLVEIDQPVEALVEFERARTIREQLIRDEPTSVWYQGDLAKNYLMVGQLHAEIHEPTQALAAYQQALSIQELLAQKNPTVTRFCCDLASTLEELARLEFGASRYAEARDRLQAAIQWQLRALELDSRDSDLRRHLERHYAALSLIAARLHDTKLAWEARLDLAKLVSNDPQLAGLDQRLAAVLGGDPAKDSAEWVALGQRAYDTRRFALASRLFGNAIDYDKNHPESQPAASVYNAACAAALAAGDHAVDAPPADATARAEFRAQALRWLQAELDRSTTLLATATPEQRQSLAQTLQHWQIDLDFDHLREPAQLALLDESERQAWTALWARVEALLSQAEPQVAPPAPIEPPQENQ